MGEHIGVSKRVIAYYEGETKYPPAHLIIPLSEALNISAEELLGVRGVKNTLDPQLAALWRRLKILETFTAKDRKAVLQFVEVIAQRNKAQQAANNQSA